MKFIVYHFSKDQRYSIVSIFFLTTDHVQNIQHSMSQSAILARFHLYIKKATRLVQLLNSSDDIQLLEWSTWLDFNHTTIDKVPESEGVYKLHASMKILFIGSSKNLKQSLTQDLTNPCINNNSRFSYAIVETADRERENLLNEYRNKHDGKLPLCM